MSDQSFDGGEAAILDVGTGTATLAVAYAEAFPGVRVVGLDVLPRIIALAEATVAASSVADRVEIRRQSVAELDETDRYAYAWLPAHSSLSRRCARGSGGSRRRWCLTGAGLLDLIAPPTPPEAPVITFAQRPPA